MFCYLACVPVRERKTVFAVLQYSTFSFFYFTLFFSEGRQNRSARRKKHSLDASLYM